MLNVCFMAKLPESPTEARNPTPSTPTASGLLTEEQQRFITHLPALAAPPPEKPVHRFPLTVLAA